MILSLFFPHFLEFSAFISLFLSSYPTLTQGES